MFQVEATEEFQAWFDRLKDLGASARIRTRIRRVEAGLLGDVKYFSGIGELRIDYGPGYRVYFVKRGQVVILLLCGGDKSSQKRDVETAKALAREVP